LIISNYNSSLTFIIVLCSLIQFSCCTALKAEDGGRHLSFSTAVFDVLQQDQPSLEGRIEYRGLEFTSNLRPMTGLMANTDGAIYFYSGLVCEIALLPFLYFTPSFAPGIYYQSQSKNLDFFLEFRSQFELALILENDVRVGVSFNHISNGSLGVTNPGVESIAISYYFPF
jgi:hypothetical protein